MTPIDPPSEPLDEAVPEGPDEEPLAPLGGAERDEGSDDRGEEAEQL